MNDAQTQFVLYFFPEQQKKLNFSSFFLGWPKSKRKQNCEESSECMDSTILSIAVAQEIISFHCYNGANSWAYKFHVMFFRLVYFLWHSVPTFHRIP